MTKEEAAEEYARAPYSVRELLFKQAFLAGVAWCSSRHIEPCNNGTPVINLDIRETKKESETPKNPD